jgi:phenylpropionate dioxygenase-like ring-hydroxylating dioxygenase large terminal subunit
MSSESHALPHAGELAGALAPPDRATSLPPSLYTDPAAFELERQSVFASSWFPVARVDEVASSGRYTTFDLGGEPIVVVRGSDGNVRAFPNVCRHRSLTIMQDAGTVKALQCPYHQWTWSLDGRLAGAPEMQKVDGFDRAAWCLPELRVEIWNGWVLVNLDPAAPSFASTVQALTAKCEPYDLSRLVTGPTVSYKSAFNWKIQIENFSESYHHAGVHSATLQPTFPGQRSWAEANGGEPWLWLDHVSIAEGIEPFTATVAFPLLVFSIVRGSGVLWFKLQPRQVDLTTLDIVILVDPDTTDGQAEYLAETARLINDEDVPINERTHAGLRSRFAQPGPVSHLELGCWQFRRWLAERMISVLPDGPN